MKPSVDILDSGADPGRYTVVYGDGRVITCNQDGTIVRQRTVTDPLATVTALSRTRGIRIVPPSKQEEIIKKINRYLKPEHDH